jgi:DNA-binding HxlR family transcriptional regulator
VDKIEQEKEAFSIVRQMYGKNVDLVKQCPIHNTFRIVGKKFTVLILRNMMYFGQSRFNQFIDSVEGINPKTLSARLREMEKDGLIERKVFHETPVRVEYTLTEKGKALRPILEQMAEYSMRFSPADIFIDGKPRTMREILGQTTG